MVLNQHQKNFQVLGLEPQTPAFAQQYTFVAIQAEAVEFVQVPRSHTTSDGKVFCRKSGENLKALPIRGSLAYAPRRNHESKHFLARFSFRFVAGCVVSMDRIRPGADSRR